MPKQVSWLTKTLGESDLNNIVAETVKNLEQSIQEGRGSFIGMRCR